MGRVAARRERGARPPENPAAGAKIFNFDGFSAGRSAPLMWGWDELPDAPRASRRTPLRASSALRGRRAGIGPHRRG